MDRGPTETKADHRGIAVPSEPSGNSTSAPARGSDGAASSQLFALHRGYRLPGYHNQRFTAAFLPDLSQVWTNPFLAKGMVERALVEEIVHATSTQYRPAQLYPAMNRLSGEKTRPADAEFYDLIEGLYFASIPLFKERPVDARCLPRYPPEHRAIGKRVLGVARKLAEQADPSLFKRASARDALWAIWVFLLYVVPTCPGQAYAILDLLERFPVQARWNRAHLFRQIYAWFTPLVLNDPELHFSIARPQEPHRNVEILVQFLLLATSASADRLLPVVPSLLDICSLGLSTFVPIVWLRQRRGRILANVELFDQTPSRLLAAKRRPHSSVVLKREGARARLCPAGRFQARIHRILSDCHGTCLTRGLTERIRSLLEFICTAIVDLAVRMREAADQCSYCRAVIRDGAFLRHAQSLASAPDQLRPKVISAMFGYEEWLRRDLPLEIARETGVDPPQLTCRPHRLDWKPKRSWHPRS